MQINSTGQNNEKKEKCGCACFPVVFRLTNNKGRSASIFALLTGASMFCMYLAYNKIVQEIQERKVSGKNVDVVASGE